ncbi:hypothetical protein KR009_002388 [Drosophila setifemur]|nr:hypothetical protein KR009_002388 [Drosophila setifemur]
MNSLRNVPWESMKAVEQIEVSFQQALEKIQGIGHRYKKISAERRRARMRQDAYDSEIHAAITEPTCEKNPKAPKKSRKIKKIRLVAKKRINTIEIKGKQYIQSPFLPPPKKPEENLAPPEATFLRLQHKCIYEIHNTTAELTPRKPFQALIQRLYRAARRKSLKEARKRDQDQDGCPECINDVSRSCSCSSCCYLYG